jgi:hypothetical protein
MAGDYRNVESLLTVVAEQFKVELKTAILEKLRADMEPELEAMATAEAGRVSEAVITYWQDHRMAIDWLDWRFKVNGKEVVRAAT